MPGSNLIGGCQALRESTSPARGLSLEFGGYGRVNWTALAEPWPDAGVAKVDLEVAFDATRGFGRIPNRYPGRGGTAPEGGLSPNQFLLSQRGCCCPGQFQFVAGSEVSNSVYVNPIVRSVGSIFEPSNIVGGAPLVDSALELVRLAGGDFQAYASIDTAVSNTGVETRKQCGYFLGTDIPRPFGSQPGRLDVRLDFANFFVSREISDPDRGPDDISTFHNLGYVGTWEQGLSCDADVLEAFTDLSDPAFITVGIKLDRQLRDDQSYRLDFTRTWDVLDGDGAIIGSQQIILWAVFALGKDAATGDSDASDSGDENTGSLETGGLVTGSLDTGTLQSGGLTTGSLDIGTLQSGGLFTGSLKTSQLESGGLTTGSL